MIDAMMHIGLGKCGSSALQSALSMHPVQPFHAGRYEFMRYIAIDALGSVSSGRVLSNMASTVPSKYLASTDLNNSVSWTVDTFNNARNQLSIISNDGDDLIILSNEGWSHQADQFRDQAFLEQLNINPKAVCYVRNPVDLINSAWWQWGAWSSFTLDAFLEEAIFIVSTLYVELAKWQNLLRKEELIVKLVPDDIVSDFGDLIGVELRQQTNRNNESLPAEILRFYQKHPHLRPSMHESDLDFILSNALDFDDSFGKTPWVLNREHIQKILAETKSGTIELLHFMDDASKKQCLADQRWWCADPFEKHSVVPTDYTDQSLPYESLDRMLLRAIESIKKLSMDNLELKKKLLN